jgi:hypothetical protein
MRLSNLRKHKVLGKHEDTELHALVWIDGKYGGIIFSYSSVQFEEDAENDKLRIKFTYDIHEKPKHIHENDKLEFEAELGDFLAQLLYYGLEKDHLGLIPNEN